mmetsp:Transcript_12754/g.25590  ORF Transcript_12754/g.25590 Transcript_12754/m.25590 type:complete len:204 (-) Transcript_12754:564-1175(-)
MNYMDCNFACKSLSWPFISLRKFVPSSATFFSYGIRTFLAFSTSFFALSIAFPSRGCPSALCVGKPSASNLAYFALSDSWRDGRLSIFANFSISLLRFSHLLLSFFFSIAAWAAIFSSLSFLNVAGSSIFHTDVPSALSSNRTPISTSASSRRQSQHVRYSAGFDFDFARFLTLSLNSDNASRMESVLFEASESPLPTLSIPS